METDAKAAVQAKHKGALDDALAVLKGKLLPGDVAIVILGVDTGDGRLAIGAQIFGDTAAAVTVAKSIAPQLIGTLEGMAKQMDQPVSEAGN